MENAPAIIIFWWFGIIVFILMFAFLIAAILFTKKGNTQDRKSMRLLGKICFILCVPCSVPVLLVIGYILYIYIT